MKHVYKLVLLFVCLNSAVVFSQNSYFGKPRYEIVTTQNSATLGIITVELFQNIAPYHVRNFDSLVGKKFYDTTAFHRVVPGFVIQGGDPNSRSGPVSSWGFGQPSQPTVKAEFSVARHERGILSAARSSNINSATSQFFICVAAAPNLNGNYSVYGRVTSGMSVVDQIVATPTVAGTQRPVNKIEMFVRFIGVNDTVAPPPQLIAPKNDSSSVDTTIVQLKWNAVSGGIIYHVDVARDSLFTDTLKSFDTASLTYNATYLPANTRCFWKIKVNNGGFFTDSEIRHFTTKGKVKEQDLSGVSELIGVQELKVFPNPANESILLSGLRVGQTLQIVNASGKEVYSQQINSNTLSVRIANWASDVYYYKVVSRNQIISSGSFVKN